ncbi:MAG: hypothetical protein H0X42_00395 [Solirubrobacterales bacterium]|nr:hypothetical protein [Solirubrobacterales bacterium]
MKILLLPMAIIAFVLFLILLGAIGLGIAFAVLAFFGKLWRLVSRSGRQPSS